MSESTKTIKDLSGPLTSSQVHEAAVDGVVTLGVAEVTTRLSQGQEEGTKSAKPGVEADDPHFAQEGYKGAIARRPRSHFLEVH
jgi:hypothetical protein